MYISRVIRMSDCAKGFCERQREALDAMRALNVGQNPRSLGLLMLVGGLFFLPHLECKV